MIKLSQRGRKAMGEAAIPQAENFLFNGSGVEPGASGMLGECCATD